VATDTSPAVSSAICRTGGSRSGWRRPSKVSDHWVRSPLLNLNRACQTCHTVPEKELEARVLDFVAAENSLGFHAPQELARILGKTIDHARQGQLEAERARRSK
jgi:nitrite reductase (cytochrome c-552)